jgi:hypothetical protein
MNRFHNLIFIRIVNYYGRNLLPYITECIKSKYLIQILKNYLKIIFNFIEKKNLFKANSTKNVYKYPKFLIITQMFNLKSIKSVNKYFDHLFCLLINNSF